MSRDQKVKKLYDTFTYKPPSPKSEKEIVKLWLNDSVKPVVSIICHTFQHENFLKDALNGFLMQKTNFPFEIIVRDDASTDGTRKIVEEYSIQYPTIIKAVFESENTYSKGIKPLSITLPLAKGKYIALCEGDDFWADENKLDKQVAFMEGNNEYVLTYHDAIVVGDDKNIQRESLLGDNKVDYTNSELIMSASIPTLTRCFRNVIEKMPEEYNHVKNGDTFLISLLSEYGGAKYLKGIQKSIYRRHSGGVWAGIDLYEKREMVAITYYWMSIYYNRIGLYHIAEKYSHNAILQFSMHLKINKVSALKFFVHSLFPDVYLKIKSFMKSIFKK